MIEYPFTGYIFKNSPILLANFLDPTPAHRKILSYSFNSFLGSVTSLLINFNLFSFNNLATKLLQKLCISPDLSDLVKKILSNFFPISEVLKHRVRHGYPCSFNPACI